MSEWLDNQKVPNSNFRKLLQERIEKANPRRKLTVEEAKRLAKLEAIADKLKHGENVQNRQLQTWLSEEEYAQLEYEWKEQLELRSELKDKPSDLKRYEEKLREATFNYNRAEGYSSKGKHESARVSRRLFGLSCCGHCQRAKLGVKGETFLRAGTFEQGLTVFQCSFRYILPAN